MRLPLAMFSVLALLGSSACQKKNDETGARTDFERSGTDTIIKSGSVKDTTVIHADTTINVDTVKKTEHIDKARKKG